jgi:hypothetical protein
MMETEVHATPIESGRESSSIVRNVPNDRTFAAIIRSTFALQWHCVCGGKCRRLAVYDSEASCADVLSSHRVTLAGDAYFPLDPIWSNCIQEEDESFHSWAVFVIAVDEIAE